jgi:diaminohydroxyphosphoribosylaminopyrimidine deaminase / 5-amino-6-(5-phosphoribosylamino)uracil reductase
MNPTTEIDREMLRRALELAEGGRGRVSPNPLVGAVIVRDGAAIGEGFHAELGGLHAERAALEDCRRRGEDPAGATMYLGLEPCAHQGRQPPCVEAILEAGIGRVVVASEDPTEKASGRGPGILRDGGVEVVFAAGAEAAAARLLNQPFRKHARTGLPFVTLKLAMTAAGKTTTPPGQSPWISGEQSRALVHRWRAESDAIAVGIGTVLADDPLLTARAPAMGAFVAHGETNAPSGVRQPIRIVFDSEARLPLDSQLLHTLDRSPVLVVTSADVDPERATALRDAGAEVIVAAGATSADRIHAALSDLGRREVTSLFLEGGATLAAAFSEADAIDESRIFIAPRPAGPVAVDTPTVLGTSGSSAPWGSPTTAPPAGGAALESSRQQVGEDTLITTRFKEW